MITNLSSLILAVAIVILVIALIKLNKSKEKFSGSYDPLCMKTCKTQSTNADDQCLSDCQRPCNNKCWEDCFDKAVHFDDYLRCGVRCPFGYFSP